MEYERRYIMKKIVPFRKEFPFLTNLAEITSISLEHTLHIDTEHTINGELTVSGNYKMAENSTNTEPFTFEIPCDINVDEQYSLKHAVVDIDDFYYEIINNRSLSVNIDVKIDKVEDAPLMEPREEKIEKVQENVKNALEEREEKEMEERELEEVTPVISELPTFDEAEIPFKTVENVTAISQEMETPRMNVSEVKTLFDQMDEASETYTTYKVCIVREEDTLENVMVRYSISKEELEKYNDLREIKIGDKLIIPALYAKN